MVPRPALLLLLAAFSVPARAENSFRLVGNWDVEVVATGGKTQIVHVQPPAMTTVNAERYSALPMFNPKAGGWVKGSQLNGVRAQETTSPNLLDPASLVLRDGPGENAKVLVRGVDYEADLLWGTFGRLEGSSIQADEAVFATYRHAQIRLDAVVVTKDGAIRLRQGAPRSAAPIAPLPAAGETSLGTIYLPGFVTKLEADHLFPVLETAYPEVPISRTATLERLLKRLNTSQPLRVLAWGDSVTDGGYVMPKERWQEQFITRLRERFPKCRLELITQAWGGRNTGSYLAEPTGSVHNYRETVLAMKPDLIISEFVNDAGLKPEMVEERYTKLLADFKAIGAEWIILTPHYVRPDWMNLAREREVDEDPRPYVKGVREFASKHDVALADASLRYGRLWRQGIPYNTLMLNSINHPDGRGMKIFADALMALFE